MKITTRTQRRSSSGCRNMGQGKGPRCQGNYARNEGSDCDVCGRKAIPACFCLNARSGDRGGRLGNGFFGGARQIASSEPRVRPHAASLHARNDRLGWLSVSAPSIRGKSPPKFEISKKMKNKSRKNNALEHKSASGCNRGRFFAKIWYLGPSCYTFFF